MAYMCILEWRRQNDRVNVIALSEPAQGADMNTAFRTTGAVVVAAAGLTMAAAFPAAATTSGGQDGLVNVNTGDINILQDVNVAAVVPVVAQLCDLDVTVPANLAVLTQAIQDVDATDKSYTVCKILGGDVKVVQN
jgi:hypothetical protein